MQSMGWGTAVTPELGMLRPLQHQFLLQHLGGCQSEVQLS